MNKEILEIDKLTLFEEVIQFAEENGRMPKVSKQKTSEIT